MDKLEDPYCWGKAYARSIEPLMRDLWFKIVAKINIFVQNGCCIINENEKNAIGFYNGYAVATWKTNEKA